MGRKSPFTSLLCITALSTALKLLLLAPNVYRSTDFEVHRNWLAITHSLPPSQWYWDEGSEWTLDYPPLFAWFEYVLSLLGHAVDSVMTDLKQLNYESLATVRFQKLSVIVCDLALVGGLLLRFRCNKSIRGVSQQQPKKLAAAAALVLPHAGLFIVDHIHFQYNGVLLGLLLVSTGLIKHRKLLAAGVTFAVLVMMKHLFITLAPLYLVYLLRTYCYCWLPRFSSTRAANGSRGKLSITRLATMGTAVTLVVLMPLLSLCWPAHNPGDGSLIHHTCSEQVHQLLNRLFPFGRGLVHAYWAPNVWALYMATDRVALLWLKLTGSLHDTAYVASTTGGLVHNVGTSVLPPITPSTAMLLTLAAILPALVKVWRCPTPRVFQWAAIHSSLSAFMLGWHVHEKAILVPILQLAVLAIDAHEASKMFMMTSIAGVYALLPLIIPPREQYIAALLHWLYLMLASSVLGERWKSRTPKVKVIGPLEKCAVGILAIRWLMLDYVLYMTVPGMAFMPQLLTSVLCSVALLVPWVEVFICLMKEKRQ
ncbi:unnamed protein product [Chrysoparadoxa australica]